MRSIKYWLFGISLLSLSSCGNQPGKQELGLNYRIVKEEKHETSQKALLLEYVVYEDSNYTQNVLKKVLTDVYDNNKNKDLFENYDAPTVFVTYLYTSPEIFMSNKGEWICMLTKGPLDNEPEFSFNDLKLNSIQGLNDNEKSNAEIALDNLNEYLEERGLELCSFYKKLGDLELECIHKADAKYPNFDFPEHAMYSDKCMKEERLKLSAKYDIADTIYVRVAIFGMSYCK